MDGQFFEGGEGMAVKDS